MFCKHCGQQITPGAAVCIKCGVSAGQGASYCHNCGAQTDPAAAVCVKCGVQLNSASSITVRFAGDKEWLVALLLSIFLGTLGIDRFYLGYTTLGIVKLLTGGGCGVWALIDIILIAMDKLPDADGKPLKK